MNAVSALINPHVLSETPWKVQVVQETLQNSRVQETGNREGLEVAEIFRALAYLVILCLAEAK